MTERAGVSRRALLLGTGVLVAGGTVGGAGVWELIRSPGSGRSSGLTGTEPQVLRSVDGRLEVELVVAWTDTTIGGRPARLLTYNGSSPGPTMSVRPGDELVVRVVNHSGEPTNLHTHGLHVSPAGNSDNVFVTIADGASHTYTYHLAEDHRPGIAWYHPHHHGSTADQLFAGLCGALIVEDTQPAAGVAERVLVVHDTTLTSSGDVAPVSMMSRRVGREGNLLLVNGGLAPRFDARPGALERWRIVNACASRYLDLRVAGATATLVGKDFGRYTRPGTAGTITLAPGNRADLLVHLGNAAAGLRYTSHSRGAMTDRMGGRRYHDEPIATVEPAGLPAVAAATPTLPASHDDLRTRPVTHRRTFVYGMGGGTGGGGGMGGGMGGGGGMSGGGFTINGAAFDPAVDNTTVSIGDTEEWTIENPTEMNHPFHLHVWPMQLLDVGGTPVDGIEYQDVVDVPPGSHTVVRVHFDAYPGRTMYHCHILDHEDLGMMGVIHAD